MSASCFTDRTFARIIDELYAGTLSYEDWDRAIRAIAGAVRASGAFLLAFNPENGALLRYENYGLNPELIVEYQKRWADEDKGREAFLNFPKCIPVTERMLPLDLAPVDAPHFMPAWLHKAPNKVVMLSFPGTRQRGPFQSRDLAAYKQVLPHIVRTLEIRDRLEQAQIRNEMLAKRLVGSLTFGVVVLDAEGKVLESNPVAKEIFRASGGVRCQPDHPLRFRGAEGAKFAQVIAARMPASVQSEGLLHVPLSNGASLSVVVTPLPKSAVAWMGVEPRWLVLLFDSERRTRINADLIAGDLKISASEAEIAAMIAGGHTTLDVAQSRGVTEGTVRAQLKSIYRKTSIHSQSELVRRITLGPAVQAESPLQRSDDDKRPSRTLNVWSEAARC